MNIVISAVVQTRDSHVSNTEKEKQDAEHYFSFSLDSPLPLFSYIRTMT